MTEISMNRIPSIPADKTDDRSPEKIGKAAQEFESLLLEQMLRSARACGTGDWMGASEDQTGMPMAEMAEQQFAQMLSANGGLGLAKLVVEGLGRKP